MAEETAVEGSSEGLSDALGEIKNIMAVLRPPKEVTVNDIYGNDYELRLFLSAEQQIEVVRILDKMSGDFQDKGFDLSGGAKGIAQSLVSLATDIKVARALGEAFSLAHPKAFDSAKKAAKSEDGKKVSRATEVFSIEDIVSGVVPFLLRSVLKMMDLIQAQTAED